MLARYSRSKNMYVPVDQDAEVETFFVDTVNGVAGGSGRGWADAFLTMAEAFAVVTSGAIIRVRGKVTEQLSTPVNIFDVSILGAGTRPRHADATPAGGNRSAAQWAAPGAPVAATALLTIRQQGWRLQNILFAGPADAPCVRLFRDAGAGDLERDASHAEFVGCRFASGLHGISDTGGCYGVLVEGCRFLAMTGFAILGVGNIGVGQSAWQIFANAVNGCANGIKIAGFGCDISGNYFDDGGTPNTTVVLNTNNGGGDNNIVVENFFQTLTANFNTPDVVGAATDMWNNSSFDGEAGMAGREVGVPA